MTADEVKQIALAIAEANQHPNPDDWVDLVAAAFNGKPVDVVAESPKE